MGAAYLFPVSPGIQIFQRGGLIQSTIREKKTKQDLFLGRRYLQYVDMFIEAPALQLPDTTKPRKDLRSLVKYRDFTNTFSLPGV